MDAFENKMDRQSQATWDCDTNGCEWKKKMCFLNGLFLLFAC